MKKYLMTGIAAVAMSAAFVSCGHDEVTNYTPGEIAQAKYEAAFVQHFGQPASNQTWGFGTSTRTRANAGDNYPATSTGINANANEWADPDKGFGGWVVPDPLTEAQKEIVTAYFQTVKDLTYTDPQWRHFFVQQVYGGGKTTVRNTTEGIVAANGSEYTSENMNLLTVGANHQHINNFNGGDCSVNENVLDNGSNVNENKHHSDQIMLMVNIDDTSCFGYHETGSSTHHDNKAAIVDWQTIRTWANANGFNGELLNDGWNRSFLGFDLAIQEGEQAMDGTATYDQAAESPIYAWDGEQVIQIADVTREYPDPTNEYYYTESKTYKEGYESIFGKGWLTTNENFYKAADKKTFAQTTNDINGDAAVIKGIEGYQSVINLPFIKKMIDNGYLPVKDKTLTEWVKPGVSDGYFSDWIVTLNKAERLNVEKYDGRIIAEDLSATEASDFDFNDVVFDYKIIDGGVKIKLLAAGGTLPLTIGGLEVHELFGVGVKDMVNTGAGPEKDPVVFELTGTFSADGSDITILVNKGTDEEADWQEMKAPRGKAASKVRVDTDYDWCRERQDVDAKYNNHFTEYVAGQHAWNTWYKQD